MAEGADGPSEGSEREEKEIPGSRRALGRVAPRSPWRVISLWAARTCRGPPAGGAWRTGRARREGRGRGHRGPASRRAGRGLGGPRDPCAVGPSPSCYLLGVARASVCQWWWRSRKRLLKRWSSSSKRMLALKEAWDGPKE